jgi:hypothetical protein
MGRDCGAECEGILDRRNADFGGIMNDTKFEDGCILHVSSKYGSSLGSLADLIFRVAVEDEGFLTIDSLIVMKSGKMVVPGDRINGGPSYTVPLESEDSDPFLDARTGSWA